MAKVESWCSYLEQKILEGLVFKDIELEKVKAVNIAPWLAPACRGHTINTEHLKSNSHRSHPTPVGCPKTLARMIFRGEYDPPNLGSASITQLKEVCESVKIPKELAKTKIYILAILSDPLPGINRIAYMNNIIHMHTASDGEAFRKPPYIHISRK